jgi:ABC-type amino acid transport substrate-binding protein
MRKLVFFILFMLPVLSGFAQVSVVGAQIDDLIQKDKEGPYDQIVLKFLDENSYYIRPPKRAIYEFNQKKFDCIYPGNLVYFDQKVLNSIPVNIAKVFLVTLRGEKKLKKIPEGIKLGIVDGITYGIDLEGKGFELVATSSEKTNLKMLLAKKVDAILGYFPDFFIALDGESKKQIHYYKDGPVSIIQDVISCHPGVKSEKFLQIANEKIRQLHQDKTILGILKEFYLMDRP